MAPNTTRLTQYNQQRSQCILHFEPGCLCVDDMGVRYEYPEYCYKTINSIQKYKRSIARKVEGSNSYRRDWMKYMSEKRALKEQCGNYIGRLTNILLSQYDDVRTTWLNYDETLSSDEEEDLENIEYEKNYIRLCSRIKNRQKQIHENLNNN